MTIGQLRIQALELEAEANAQLRQATKDFQSTKPRTAEWFKASDRLMFWKDVHTGIASAADALLGLSLIEKGGDWS